MKAIEFKVGDYVTSGRFDPANYGTVRVIDPERPDELCVSAVFRECKEVEQRWIPVSSVRPYIPYPEEKEYAQRVHTRPPRGITRRRFVDERRIHEITEGMNRFSEHKMPIPLAWVEEYNEIAKRLQRNGNHLY